MPLCVRVCLQSVLFLSTLCLCSDPKKVKVLFSLNNKTLTCITGAMRETNKIGQLCMHFALFSLVKNRLEKNSNIKLNI